MDYHVALIGLPGTGKTALATALATRLTVPAYDSTAECETRMGLTVADAVAQHGDVWFRAREAETIAALINGQPPGVIVVGADALGYQSTRDLLQLYCQTFWLHVPVGVLGDRLVDDLGQPLFGRARRSVVERRLRQRYDHYGTVAHVQIWADQPAPAVLADVAGRIRTAPRTPAVPVGPG